MALDFDGGGSFPSLSDYVNHGNVLADIPDAGTIWAWVYRDTTSALHHICVQHAGTGEQGLKLRGNNGDATCRLLIFTTGTSIEAVTSTSDLPSGAWRFIAATWNIGTSVNVYSGSLTAAAAEASYSTQTAGTGAVVDASGGDFIVGEYAYDSPKVGEGFGWDGRIARIACYNSVLSLNQLIGMQFGAPPVISSCLFYSEYGINGTADCPDWSGNGFAGTLVNSPVIADHVPLRPFGFRRGSVPYAVAAAGGIPKPVALYHHRHHNRAA